MINHNKFVMTLLLGFVFALMMVPVSLLEFFSPTNGVDIGVFYKRLIIGVGFNLLFSFFIPFALFIFPERIRKVIKKI